MKTTQSGHHEKCSSEDVAGMQSAGASTNETCRPGAPQNAAQAAQASDPFEQANGLAQYIEKMTVTRNDAVRMFQHEGTRYVVKFHRRIPLARSRAWLNAALCGVMFGEFPSPRRLRTGDIHHEARHLRHLRRQGLFVPKVYLTTADHLILEYCGDTVESRLRELPGARRIELLASTVDDLANFHRAGHWHGGAQLRNLTIKDGRIYRIDFEENTGKALSLPLAQAYDVLLAFNSMIDHLNGDHPLGVQLLTRYLEQVRSEQIVQSLQKLERWLNYIPRMAPWLTRRLRHNRDLQRTCKFAGILAEALASYQTSVTDPPQPRQIARQCIGPGRGPAAQ